MNKDITGIFQNTESNLLRSIIQGGGKALGTVIQGKAGLLVKDVKFSDALQKEVEKSTGIKGFISTDELPRYGISAAEKGKALSAFSAGAKDVVVFVAGEASEGEKALQIIETGMAKKAAPKMGKVISKKKAKKAPARPAKKSRKAPRKKTGKRKK